MLYLLFQNVVPMCCSVPHSFKCKNVSVTKEYVFCRVCVRARVCVCVSLYVCVCVCITAWKSSADSHYI